MAANIQVTLRDSPGGSVVGSVTTSESREDLKNGYEVTLYSADEATTYTWSLEYTPDSPSGTANAAALSSTSARTVTFNVSMEGSYLVQLTVDDGLGTEDTEILRLRYLTEFADIKLPAAGEKNDSDSAVPTDAESEGWSDDQNENLQKLLAMVRRCSESGRVLFVDANRGRDYSEDPNDEANTFTLPGAISGLVADSGVVAKAKSFGEFSTITAAMSWAEGANGRGEAALSATDPYTIFVRSGLYVEDLDISDNVAIVGLGSPAHADLESGTAIGEGGVVIRTATTTGHAFESDTPLNGCILANVLLENTLASTSPVFNVAEGYVVMHDVGILQRGTSTTQGPALGQVSGTGTFCSVEATGCSFASAASDNDDNAVYVHDHPAAEAVFYRSRFKGRTCISVNPKLSSSASLSLWDSNVIADDGYGIRCSGNLVLNRAYVYATNADKGILVDSQGAGTHPGRVQVDLSQVTLDSCNLLYDPSDFTTGVNLHVGSLVFAGTGLAGLSQGSIQKLGAGNDPVGKMSAHSVGYIEDFTSLGPGGTVAVYSEAQASSADSLQNVLDQSFRRIGSSKMAYFNATSNLDLNTEGGSGIVGVSTGSGGFTITLPGSSVIEPGAQVIVKDIDGNASVNSIRVNTTSGNIDGVSEQSITTNYGVLRAFWDGTNWYTT